MTSIRDCDLSVRAFNVLTNARITHMEELSNYTESDFRKLKWCGKGTTAEIKSKLKTLGLSFKEPKLGNLIVTGKLTVECPGELEPVDVIRGIEAAFGTLGWKVKLTGCVEERVFHTAYGDIEL